MKIITEHNIRSANYGNITVEELFNENKHKVSFARLSLSGEQKFGVNKNSDMYFYVLSGEGFFFIEDKKISASKDDLVFIPKDIMYKHEGDLTLLAVSHPSFGREDHEYVE